MSNELVVRSFAEGKDLAASLSKSLLVPEALRGKEADILFTILTGSEMGMGPMRSMQAFEVIKGRVGMKPIFMLGMVRAHPTIKSIDLETSPTGAVVTSQRKGEEKILRTEFTLARAQTAGLTSSDMYKKWLPEMLGWRCVAIHCRTHHSDIIGGHYSTEEIATFDEKELNPAPTRVESTSTPVSLDAVKTALATKPRKREYLDATPPPAASPPQSLPAETMEDPLRVGWGKHAARLLAELSDIELAWYVVASQKPEAMPAFAALTERYVAEETRRAVEADAGKVAEVAP